MLIILTLFVGFLLLRLPFRSHYPVNWDAVQFAMAIEDFDIQTHQPHPPGYIGYVALGKLVNVFLNDPHESLALLGIIGGALAPAAFYPLARRFMAARPALLASIAFGSSMLVWYYSEVALTYSLELALLLPFLLYIHRATSEISRRDLLIASVILAMVGAFRQSALALVLPLWLYASWRYSWRDRILAGGLLGSLVMVWLAPLLWLAGGLGAYITASRELAEITGGSTSVLSLNPVGPAKNLAFVLAGLILGLNAGAAILLAGRQELAGWLSRRDGRSDRVFFALWAIPALSVYLLGHVGQIGYILILLPIPFLWLGIVLAAISSPSARPKRRLPLAPKYAGAVITLLFVAINIVGFLAIPHQVNQAVPASAPLDVRQFDIPANDAHWQALTEKVRDYPARNTAVLTTIGGPRVSGSFRHLSYLLPEYRVYGLGNDLNTGQFGPLFYAHDQSSNYSIPGMRESAPVLLLPPETRYVLIPDDEITGRIKGLKTKFTVELSDGSSVVVAAVAPGTALVFADEGERITFAQYLGIVDSARSGHGG